MYEVIGYEEVMKDGKVVLRSIKRDLGPVPETYRYQLPAEKEAGGQVVEDRKHLNKEGWTKPTNQAYLQFKSRVKR